MRRKEKAREAVRLRSVRRWGFPPKRNMCRITFVSQRHNSLCSDHSSLRRDSQTSQTRLGVMGDHKRIWQLSRLDLVSAPSGWITTITLQDGALNRLVNLYRGRGGRPKLEGASLNGWPVWRVGILLSGLICNQSARKGIVVRSRSVDEYSIFASF